MGCGLLDPQTSSHVIIVCGGNLKASVYVNIAQNLQELKEGITKKVRPIDTDLSTAVHCRKRTSSSGYHFPNMNFNYSQLHKWYI